MFAGQGYHNSDLFDLFQSERTALDQLHEFADSAHFDFQKNIKEIINPGFSQLIIGAYQLTLFLTLSELLTNHQVEFAGYSFGEVSAFLLSTKANSDLAFEVINYRTQLMTSLLNHTENNKYDLMSIKGTFELDAIEALCATHHCGIAIINSDNHLIIGGRIPDLDDLKNQLTEHQVDHIKFLSIHLPSHTPFYLPQANKFSQFLKSKFNDNVTLTNPIISPRSLKKIYNAQDEMSLLDTELYSTLNWQATCHLIAEYGYDLIIDLGPGTAMTAFLKNISIDEQKTRLLTVANFKSICGIKNKLVTSGV